MELKVTRKNMSMNETVFNESAEQAIDCEFTLPDYCPDISRILKCDIEPKINTSSLMGSSVAIDGTAYINILYVGGDPCELRGYEIPVNFTKNIDIKCNADRGSVMVTAKCDYINCRAVTQRKLDIHGAVSLHITVNCANEMEAVCDVEGGEVHLKKTPMLLSDMTTLSEKQFIINEEIELPESYGNIKNMIRMHTSAVFEDAKPVAGKVIVKGNLMVCFLYCSESGQYEKMETAIPVNQIIESPGVDEDSDIMVKMHVIASELKPHTDMNGECRVIAVSAKLGIQISAEKCTDTSIVTDAYSTYCEMNIERSGAKLRRKCAEVCDNFSARGTVTIPADSMGEIMDLWCMPPKTAYKNDDGRMMAFGDILVCMVVKNTDGDFLYHERPVSYEHRTDAQYRDNMDMNMDMRVSGCTYTMGTDGTVEVRCELKLCGYATEMMSKDIISNMMLDESRLKNGENMPALTVYYADAGDNIWNIAMKYNTSAEQIMELNNLSDEVLSGKTMLLIPAI